MKITSFIFCLLFAFTLNAQEGTSLEEYRFLTKGYAYQKEMGLDATKEGYQITQLMTSSNGVDFVGMFKRGSSTPKAILAVINPLASQPVYICLPNNRASEEILALYQKDLQQLLGYDNEKKLDTAIRELLFQQMGSISLAQRPADYDQKEEFTARGGISEPLVAASNSAPYRPKAATRVSKEPIASTEQPISAAPVPASTTGKSQVGLANKFTDREILQQATIISGTSRKGRVAIKVCVDAGGNVLTAKFTQKGSTSFDSSLIKMAVENAKQITFQTSHLLEECGTVLYSFNL